MSFPGRNAPCHCGSGKKNERCCSASSHRRAPWENGVPAQSLGQSDSAGVAALQGRPAVRGAPASSGTASVPTMPGLFPWLPGLALDSAAPPLSRGPQPSTHPRRPPTPSKAPKAPEPSIYSTITVDKITLRVFFRQKRVRNINLLLKGAELHVSAPFSARPSDVNSAIDRAVPKLLRRATRCGRGGPLGRTEPDDALRKEALAVARRFPVPPTFDGICYTERQTRCWGTYTRKTRSIRLSVIVRFMPSWVREAVIAHELAHAVHFDHSPAFWDLLHRVCPDTGRAKEFLAGVQWSAEAMALSPDAARILRMRAGLPEEGETVEEEAEDLHS